VAVQEVIMKLGEFIARALVRVGTLIVRATIRGLAFLVTRVLGPICLGVTRELVDRILTREEGKRTRRAILGRNPLAYAVVWGLLWVGGYFILRWALSPVSRAVWILVGPLFPEISPTVGLLIVPGIVFAAGVGAGALAFGSEEQFRSAW
jgi:hypothetical protein